MLRPGIDAKGLFLSENVESVSKYISYRFVCKQITLGTVLKKIAAH